MYFVIYIKNNFIEDKKKMCSKDLIEDRPTLFQLTCVPLPYKYLYSTMYSTAGHNVFQDNSH